MPGGAGHLDVPVLLPVIVKLPKERVDELVSSGKGGCFDPGHGRVMKEWLSIDLRGKALGLGVAREALEFAARGPLRRGDR